MSKASLYLVILILLGVIGYSLFVPQQEVVAPTLEDEPSVVQNKNSEATETDELGEQTTIDKTSKTGSIVFTGILTGFADGKDHYLGSYKYALINDGIEILRIDLRPLIGYDITNLEIDLGVVVGSTVKVTGEMEAGKFVIISINLIE